MTSQGHVDQEDSLEQAHVAGDRGPRDMQVGLKAASGDKEARPGSEQPDERAELRRALDLGELPDLAVDQVLHVRVEETAAAAWVGSRHGLGQAAAHDPVGRSQHG